MLRKSVVAGLPIATFEWLLERSLPFNRHLMNQLNERLSQFIAAREIDRMTDPDTKVARSLGALFHPVLYPGVGEVLRITQQELGYLVGPVAPACQRGADAAAGQRLDPRRIRRGAGARPGRAAARAAAFAVTNCNRGNRSADVGA